MGSHAGSVHSERAPEEKEEGGRRKRRRTGERKLGTDRRAEVRDEADTQAMQDAQIRDKRQEIISET